MKIVIEINSLELITKCHCEEERRSNPENISPIIWIASSVASLLPRKDSEIYVFRNPR
ncbi:MAG: hypothetical protein GWO87_00950 [Xanthomonadaceae bacterium]|nr:hypothetical protein [Rhodospirillaceae bacterium]NIA17742.1 hypothetical protein [Xanthomonadaceae bacterium]